MTKAGAMQRQCTGDQALTRARESEVVADSSRTGGVGHTEGILSGNLGKMARRGAGGPAEEEEIMSQYELDRLRRMKVNEDFMRSLGIEMSASISKRTTVENGRRRRTRAGVDREGTATVGRTIRTPSAEPRDVENACLLGKKGEVFKAVVRMGIWEG